MEDLIYALDVDHAHRSKYGVEGDLHHLPLMDKSAQWGFELPTVVRGDNSRGREDYGLGIDLHATMYPNLPKDDAEFRNRFFTIFPFLNGMDFSNVLIAGGTVQLLLRNDQTNLDINSSYYFNSNKIHDIDVFFYDLNHEQAIQKIHQIQQFLMAGNNNKGLKYMANQYTLSIFYPIQSRYYQHVLYYEIQFIFRLYRSISEMLHGFDLGSSAVGFDGNQVYFTSLSRFSYEYGLNIIDTSRRSTSYEYRLAKYLQRGFNIVIPQLRIDSVNKIYHYNKKYNSHNYYPTYNSYAYVAEDHKMGYEKITMPYCKIYIKQIDGNRITGSFSPRYSSKYRIQSSDYGRNTKYRQFPDNDYYRHTIKGYCPQTINKILKGEYDKIHIMNDNFEDVINYQLDEDKIMKQVDEMFEYQINRNGVLNKPLFAQTRAGFKQDLDLIKQQVLNYCRSHKGKINFIIDNPGSQLTSSINPIFEKEIEWYGRNFYLPPPDLRRDLIVGCILGHESAIKEIIQMYSKDTEGLLSDEDF